MHGTGSLRIFIQNTMTLFYRILQFREYLTGRADMRSALANNDPFNRGTTYRAWFALTAVHSEMVLEIASAVNPIYAGTIAVDAFLQYFPDCHSQDLGFFLCHRIRGGQRMEPGHMQSFIRIYVT